MYEINFTEQKIDQLNHERYHHPHPRVQLKMEAVYLKSQGLPHQEIARLCRINGNTLRSYLRDYHEGGIEKLKEINFYRPASELFEYKQSIEDYFREHPPMTVNETASKIEELTGIKRGLTQVKKFLKSLGMKPRKVGMIPAKADPEEQEIFKKKLNPRLKEAKEGKRVVLFVDAAHFVYKAYLGLIWCFSRVFIKAPSGRERLNILGAVNAITHELTLLTNTSYINAETFCDFLKMVVKQYVHVPITLVLDNERYQKCALVREMAKALNIELLYLPSYSPNLNLIERLWKFVKKKRLYSKYYSDFQLFSSTLIQCVEQSHSKHKNELKSLLTLNFQSFKT